MCIVMRGRRARQVKDSNLSFGCNWLREICLSTIRTQIHSRTRCNIIRPTITVFVIDNLDFRKLEMGVEVWGHRLTDKLRD